MLYDNNSELLWNHNKLCISVSLQWQCDVNALYHSDMQRTKLQNAKDVNIPTNHNQCAWGKKNQSMWGIIIERKRVAIDHNAII